MPVSTSVHISHCLQQIIGLNPRSVLDVGCGFGLWGFLCREYLDVMNERVGRERWQTRIDGIELFEPYILEHQRFLYSSIRIGDIRDLAPEVEAGAYDLIITGDVIEHLEKADGERVLAELYEKAGKALLVNIPLGEGWDHPERHGNAGELHRSQWTTEDFLSYPGDSYVFELPCGQYGVFWCSKDAEAVRRSAALLGMAEVHFRQGDYPKAVYYAGQAHALEPGCPESATFLADLLIRQGDVDGAITTLGRSVEANRGFAYGYLALARLLESQSRHTDARNRLIALLALEEAPLELRREAEESLARLEKVSRPGEAG